MVLKTDVSLPVEYWDSSISYEETVRRQEDFVQRGEEALLFCEHPPTITLGTATEKGDLLFPNIYYERQGIDIYKSPRGGKATYHGPGQMVFYPILNLRRRNITIHEHLRLLEEVMLRLCSMYGVKARTIEGKTGAWVENRKIGFIGIRVRRGFVFHGCSVNVAPQEEVFRMIVPCGMPQLSVTSLQEETGMTYEMRHVADTMKGIFFRIAGILPAR